MIGEIKIDLFRMSVTVFESDAERCEFLKSNGVEPEATGYCLASAHRDYNAEGRPFFSMVIKPGAGMSGWAHECAHIADFVMDQIGIPMGMENYEIRGYLVQRIFSGLQDMMDVPQ